ncbi:START domain-containing protein [Marinobacter caseinilyticus]|uniref:START domain-containing protein n=1 Tax=Marinobacter caseinilyticus TaxID=2692195 RepID=UPI0014093ADE|nr:START domain-containing protein [Marinobacter caseinilyticus]
MLKCNTHRIPGWIMAVASVLFTMSASAQLPGENAEWSLKKQTGAIKIYTIERDDSDFRAFKADALLDAPLANLMAVMTNPESCVEWVYGCVESYGFGDGDFHDRYAYSVNNMPWPVTDRDYVLRIRTRGDLASGEVIMDLNAVPARRGKEARYVRVDRSDTFYRFTPDGDKTHMIWIQHTDPNGALPSWLVNSLLVDIPIESMQQLEKVAHKPRYQNHRLLFNSDGILTGVVPSSSADTQQTTSE